MTQADDEERITEQAIAWHRSLARDDADWDGYAAWLAQDPRHRAIFDEIALLDDTIDRRAAELRPLVSPPENEERAPPHRRRLWLGGVAAAALAMLTAIPFLATGHPDQVYATATGETRRIALGQGEVATLGPGSRLIASGGDPRRLRLLAGEAYFAVAHDPRRRLSIAAGGVAIDDIGTEFGVDLAADTVTVAVAEGNLSVTGKDGRAIRLGGGNAITASQGVPGSVAPVAAHTIGSWRQGRLAYDRAPLAIVAQDLARHSGRKVELDPAIAGRPFSGVLSIGDRSRLFQDLADLMGLAVRPIPGGVRFSPRDR